MGRSLERAERWQDGLEKAVQSLEEFPKRCALVPEASTPERQVRQLLYGVYRLLFTLLDTNGDGDLDTVRILHVRHGAQKPILYEDPEEAEYTMMNAELDAETLSPQEVAARVSLCDRQARR